MLHVVFMLMMMMSRFCIVCVFFITLPAYVILGSLNTISTMVELCNNGSEFALHIHKIIIITIFLILS